MTAPVLNAFGDSVTCGVAASVPANSFLSLTCKAKQWTSNNLAVSGSEAGDQAAAIYGVAPTAGFRSVYMIGKNNQRHFNLNPVNLASFQSTVMAQAAWLAILNTDLIRGSAASYSSASMGWNTATVYGSMGKYTDTCGDSYSYSIPPGSSVIYLGTIQQDGNLGEETIYVDGIMPTTSQGSYPVAPTSSITTALGIGYMPKLCRIDGLDPSVSHTVYVEKTSPTATGNRIYSGWCWGNGMKTQCQYPKVWLGTPTPFNAAGYASAGGSLLATIAYRDAVLAAQKQLNADGLNVYLWDAFSCINTATDLSADNCHENDAGHNNLARSLIVGLS